MGRHCYCHQSASGECVNHYLAVVTLRCELEDGLTASSEEIAERDVGSRVRGGIRIDGAACDHSIIDEPRSGMAGDGVESSPVAFATIVAVADVCDTEHVVSAEQNLRAELHQIHTHSRYPLNSRRLTTWHLQALAGALGLPIAGSPDQLSQCVEGIMTTTTSWWLYKSPRRLSTSLYWRILDVKLPRVTRCIVMHHYNTPKQQRMCGLLKHYPNSWRRLSKPLPQLSVEMRSKHNSSRNYRKLRWHH